MILEETTKQVTSLIWQPVFSMWKGLATAYSLAETSPPNLQASTGGKYDIQLGFQTSGGLSSQFNHGDTVVFDITTAQKNTSLSSQDFAFRSIPGTAGSFYAASYFGGTGSNGKGTDYAGATTFTVLGVPEPASGFAAAGICLAGLAVGFPNRAKKAVLAIFA